MQKAIQVNDPVRNNRDYILKNYADGLPFPNDSFSFNFERLQFAMVFCMAAF